MCLDELVISPHIVFCILVRVLPVLQAFRQNSSTAAGCREWTKTLDCTVVADGTIVHKMEIVDPHNDD